MNEKEKKKWWQRIFQNYQNVIILCIGIVIGWLIAVFFIPLVMFVIGLIVGYTYHKFLSIREKGKSDKKENNLKTTT